MIRKSNGDMHMSLAKYINNTKPITLHKDRAKETTSTVTAAEHRQLRGLLGAMAWSSAQAAPHGRCSVSLLQGISQPTVATIQEANKTLRFFKQNSDVSIIVKKVADKLEDTSLVVLTDAAWAVREDGSSQGGFLILLCNKNVLKNENSDYVVIDWRSWKLPRVSRSSLGGVDALEFTKCFYLSLIHI